MAIRRALRIAALLLLLARSALRGTASPWTPPARLVPVLEAGGAPAGVPPLAAAEPPATATVVTPTYVFPVQPAALATYGPEHHDYPACDIFAPAGTSFVAVTAGTVDEVSYEDLWDPESDDPALRGGLFVSIVGDDGVRYYGSHLSALVPGLSPGRRVSAGELLGYVGNSGNARTTPPHLHLGISHPTYPGDWAVRRGEVWPYPFLQAWQSGRPLTPGVGQKRNLGASTLGYSIDAYRFGHGPVRVAIVGGLHGGYEANTVHLAMRMLRFFQRHLDQAPAGVTLYLVPCANPDGYYARGRGEAARFNGRGVDLNRNWDYAWAHSGQWKEGRRVDGGRLPFSEAETRALRDFFAQEEIAVAVFYHSQGSFIALPPHSPGSWDLARCFSHTTGYALAGGAGGLSYQVTGDAAGYLSVHGVAVIDIELTDHEDEEWKRNLRGLLDGLACWLARP